jgi:hypothetical protein
MSDLKTLEKRIKDKFGDSAWLFKTIGNVKGYYSTGFCERYRKKIMFVAERPSKGGLKKSRTIEALKKDPPLMLFYKTLELFNLENAHITDFIKTKARAGEWNYDDIRANLEIFDQEFKIVSPKVVICIGEQSFHWLSLYLLIKKINLKPYKLMHYSQRRPIESYEHKFITKLKEIVEDISTS